MAVCRYLRMIWLLVGHRRFVGRWKEERLSRSVHAQAKEIEESAGGARLVLLYITRIMGDRASPSRGVAPPKRWTVRRRGTPRRLPHRPDQVRRRQVHTPRRTRHRAVDRNLFERRSGPVRQFRVPSLGCELRSRVGDNCACRIVEGVLGHASRCRRVDTNHTSNSRS